MYRRFKYTNLTLVLGVILAVGSCTRIETFRAGGEPVAFSVYGRRSLGTKADGSFIGPGGTFAEGAVIDVYGWYHDNSTWSTDTDNTPDFMYNQDVTLQEDGTWEYSPLKYWPNEDGISAANTDNLSFWACYPRGADGLTLLKPGAGEVPFDNETSGLPKIKYPQSKDPALMQDLMLADPVYNVHKNLSHTVDEETWNYGALTNGQVQLRFRHALALVEFVLDAGTGAEITSLELTRIKWTGTIADPTVTPFVWSDVGDAGKVEIADQNVSSSVVLRLLAIPQSIDADATFTLRYNITFASSDPTYDDPIVYTGDNFSVKLYKNTGPEAEQYGVTAWESGHHYTYRISAGLDHIAFEEVADESWVSYGSEISIPE